MNNTLVYSLIMFLAGVGIPVMAAMNGTVGERVGSPAAASVIIFGMGLSAAIIATSVSGIPALRLWHGVPTAYYFAGLFMAFYVLSVTYIGPRLGLGNAIFLVLVGQMVAVAAIDHFALFGAHQTPISLKRIIGILVMVVGIYLARRPPSA